MSARPPDRAVRQIVFFTTLFPYGLGEEWKRSEIVALVEGGWNVHVVPLVPHDGDPVRLPDDVAVHPPLLAGPVRWPGARIILRTIGALLRELPVALRAGPRLPRVRALLRATVDKVRVVGASAGLDIPPARWRVVYFYWGRGAAESTNLLRKVLAAQRAVVRLHRFDLYADHAPHGYLPFRSDVWSADVICTVSEDGASWLTNQRPDLSNRVQVRRLGSPSLPAPAPRSKDGVLRVVSCSSLTPVKRVDQIPGLLAATDFDRIEWTHIGDGPDRPKVEDALEGLSGLGVRLLGLLTPSEVGRELVRGSYDLFLNVSTSEGVPVSIMEALAAGIPVVATNVGGTSELIDRSVGRLVDASLDAPSVASAIHDVMDPVFREGVADRARERHAQMCDSERLAGELIAEVFEPGAPC